ncbi:hypothetical protein CC78DRAFT_156307 [Lojkania enalia]|uniref:Zn(2)-C6 fungal-type domain-containing protein n=1 Tax=Lojkania enalia TaxID=147567 RepID=A0A9P4KEU4_9PLEO|nr:hypothetical protein CC78DRAFT_156307 [Didymosphaeria enalia]
MPNVGKPSKGCKTCRDRKVKCDQKRPSCSQCIRIKRECHGYRDPVSMMFKNESEVVARRANKRYQELTRAKMQKLPHGKGSASSGHETPSGDSSYSLSSSLSSSTSSSSSSSASRSCSFWTSRDVALKLRGSQSRLISTQVMPSLEDQALCFFLSNYVVLPKFIPRGHFEWLYEVLKSDAEEILRTSVIAASLAALATSKKSVRLVRKAREAYVSALRMTNESLGCSALVKKDSTLMAVIMLGMYENCVFEDKYSLKSWAKHVDGACTLIKLRGKEIFHSPLCLRVFQQFYGTILLVAIESRSKTPPGINEFWEYCAALGNYNVSGKQWTTEMVRWIQRAIDLGHSTTADPATAIATARELLEELAHIRASLPSVWEYQTIYLEEPNEYVYGATYHVYKDPWVVWMWNNLRISHLRLLQITSELLDEGLTPNPLLFKEEEVKSQKKALYEAMKIISAEICASTPQITGQIPFPDPHTSDSGSLAKPSPGILDALIPKYKLHPPGTFTSTLVHYLIWPLYSAASLDPCPTELREWIIGRLDFIALKVGTRQAIVLADALKDGNRHSPSPILGEFNHPSLLNTSNEDIIRR